MIGGRRDVAQATIRERYAERACARTFASRRNRRDVGAAIQLAVLWAAIAAAVLNVVV